MVLDRSILDNLTSTKTTVRRQALHALRDDRRQSQQLARDDPKAYLTLVRTLMRCIEREKQENLEKTRKDTATTPSARTKLENEAVQLTSFAVELRAMVGSTIGIVGKQTKDVIAHILNAAVQPKGRALYKPLSYQYMKLLAQIVCSPARYQMSQEHIAAVTELCRTLLLSSTTPNAKNSSFDTMDVDSDHDAKAAATAQPTWKLTEEESDLCLVLSRVSLCVSTDLIDSFGDQSQFFYQFFRAKPVASAAVAHVLSTLNHLLLQTANNIADRVHPFLVTIMSYIVPYWDTKVPLLKREAAFFFRVAFWATLGGTLAPRTNDVALELQPAIEALYDCVIADIFKLGQGWSYLVPQAVNLRAAVTSSRWDYLQSTGRLSLTADGILQRGAGSAWAVLDVMAEVCARKWQLDNCAGTSDNSSAETRNNSNSGGSDASKTSKLQRRNSFFVDLREILQYPLLKLGKDAHVARCIALQLLCAILEKYGAALFTDEQLSQLPGFLLDMLASEQPHVICSACVAGVSLLHVTDEAQARNEEVCATWLKAFQLCTRRIITGVASARFLFTLMHELLEHRDLFPNKRELLASLTTPAKLLDPAVCTVCPAAVQFSLCVMARHRSHLLSTDQDIESWRLALAGLLTSESANLLSQCQAGDERTMAALLLAIMGDYDDAYTLAMHGASQNLAVFYDDTVCETQLQSFMRYNALLYEDAVAPVPAAAAAADTPSEAISHRGLTREKIVAALDCLTTLAKSVQSGFKQTVENTSVRPQRLFPGWREEDAAVAATIRIIVMFILALHRLRDVAVLTPALVNHHLLSTLITQLAAEVETRLDQAPPDASPAFVECLQSFLVVFDDDAVAAPIPERLFSVLSAASQPASKQSSIAYQPQNVVHQAWLKVCQAIVTFSSRFAEALVARVAQESGLGGESGDLQPAGVRGAHGAVGSSGQTSSVIMLYFYADHSVAAVELNVHNLCMRLASLYIRLRHNDLDELSAPASMDVPMFVLQSISAGMLLNSPATMQLVSAVEHQSRAEIFSMQLFDTLFELLSDDRVKSTPFANLCAVTFMARLGSAFYGGVESAADMHDDLVEIYKFCTHRLRHGPAMPEYRAAFGVYCLSLLRSRSDRLIREPAEGGQTDADDPLSTASVAGTAGTALPGQQLLSLLSDTDIRVRLAAGTLMCDLLLDYETQPTILRPTYHGLLVALAPSKGTAQGSFEHNLTKLELFTVIAVRVGTLQVECLSAIVSRFQHCDMDDNVTSRLNYIAKSLQFGDVAALFDEHIRSVLHEWIRSADSMDSFPFALCGWDTLESFLRATAAHVVPLACLHERRQLIDSIASAFQVDRAVLMRKHLPVTLSFVLPLYYTSGTDDPEQAHRVVERLRKDIGEKEFDVEYTKGADTMFKKLILLAADDAVPSQVAMLRLGSERGDLGELCDRYLAMCPAREDASATAHYGAVFKPHYGTESILKTLAFLTTQMGTGTVPALDVAKCTRFLHLIFANMDIAQHTRAAAASWLHICRLSLALMSTQCLAHAFVCRSIVATLVHFIAQPFMQVDVLAMIRYIIATLASLPTCADQLVLIARFLIARVTQRILQAPPLDGDEQRRLLGLLSTTMQTLAQTDLTSASALASRLPPFPQASAFDALNVTRDTVMHRIHFTDSFESLTDNLRDVSLGALRIGATQKGTELAQAVQSPDQLSAKTSAQMTLFAQELILMARRGEGFGSELTSAAVSQCLAELAPFISLDGFRLQAASSGRNAQTKDDTEEDVWLDGAMQILTRVLECLFEGSPSLVRESLKCLQCILTTPLGERAAVNLAPEWTAVLEPFLQRARRSTPKASDVATPRSLDQPDLWSQQGRRHADWIQDICAACIASLPEPFFQHLSHVVKLDPQLAEVALPYAIYGLLRHDGTGAHCTTLSTAFKSFFQRAGVQSSTAKDLMIRIVLLLRRATLLGRKHGKQATFPFPTIDYVDAADAALSCGNFSAALLFLETQPQDQHTPRFQTLLLQVVQEIGEPDGFYGAPQSTSNSAAKARFQHEGQWLNALEMDEMTLGAHARIECLERVSQDLAMLGYDRLLSHMLSGVARETVYASPQLTEAQFTSLARLGEWSLDHLAKVEDAKLGVAGNLFTALSCYNESKGDDADRLQQSRSYLESNFRIIGQQLGSSSFVCSSANVQRLIIDAYTTHRVLHTLDRGAGDQVRAFRQQLLIDNVGFKQLENSLSVEAAALRSVHRSTATQDASRQSLESQLHVIARQARKAQYLHVATYQLSALHSCIHSELLTVNGTAQPWRFVHTIDEAKILWSKQQLQPAIANITSLIAQLDGSAKRGASPVAAKVFKLAGQWVAETRLEDPDHVIQAYFERAVSAATDQQSSGVHHALAKFADEQYMACVADEHVQRLLGMQKQKQDEIAQFRALSKRSSKERQKLESHIRRLELQLQQDQADFQQYESRRQQLLELAVQHYIQTLRCGSKHDLSIFRLCSLWLENAQSPDINQRMTKASQVVPAHKFLPMFTQLAARMGHEEADSPFQTVLMRLLETVASMHPHHSLYQLIALAHGAVQGYQNKAFLQVDADTPAQSRRIHQATRILQALQLHKELADVVKQYLMLAEAYIELSYFYVDPKDKRMRSKGGGVPLSANMHIVRLPALTRVPMTTATLAVDPTGQYRDVVYIARFAQSFRLVGGINVPKVIECQGTDGNFYTQLVKGNDDLRQDATLMQVFNVVDTVLKRHANTRKRSLNIRTYKVIPLAPKAGLLEWVGNTLPIGTILTDLHARYNPDDITSQKCREIMTREFQNPSSTAKSKVRTYQRDVVPHFRPVFHHWFEETFTDLESWYRRRLAYTRSCAASSVIGYVVGLGDRHAQNILVDLSTAELIHIDLGIAFDAGKLLPVPELVPFRLTRDIVDGMGMAGVEGVFRRCCQETLKVLRDEYKVIYTILDVLRYDPLHNWTINPAKLLKYQEAREGRLSETNDDGDITSGDGLAAKSKSKADEGNKEAQRALVGVSKKLTQNVSVECQVNELIQTATNAEMLCCMFPGWQPWL
ncbi:Serine/threonine-protein kinase tel1 [Sorochytrium milnesiophthora]